MQDHIITTNRSEQWKKYVDDWSVTKKVIKEAKAYFDTGEKPSNPSSYSVDQLLFLQPDQSLKGWQNVLDDVFIYDEKEWNEQTYGEPLDKLFDMVQRSFLGFVSNFHFNPEDRAWIFRLVFGGAYSPDARFSLVMPTEKEYRKITISPDWILQALMGEFYYFLEEDGAYPYPMYLLEYIKSLLPYVTTEAFDTKEPSDRSEAVVTFYALNKIIEYASMDMTQANESDVDKIRLSQDVKSVFDSCSGNLGNYGELVKLVESEGSLV